MEITKIRLNQIEQNENSRVIYKEHDVADLIQSIKRDGLLQPVGVRPLKGGKFEAVWGNRRILACKKLGWVDIDANVCGDLETENDRDIINLVENMKRRQTSLGEEGRIIQALMDRGLSSKEIAARLDISYKRVELALDAFREAPPEFRNIIVNRVGGKKESGKIHASTYKQIVDMRRHYKLNRAQMRTLLNFAKDDNTSNLKLSKIAPLLKEGMSIKGAINAVNQFRAVTLHLLVQAGAVARLEKKHNKTINQILKDKLVEDREFKILRMKDQGTAEVDAG